MATWSNTVRFSVRATVRVNHRELYTLIKTVRHNPFTEALKVFADVSVGAGSRNEHFERVKQE